jgi:glutamate racemase
MSEQRFHHIGMFDSGIGGLTVMQQVMHVLPYESIIYFGDTARLPYGNKSQETVERYSIENTIFLLEKRIKLLVVACNTASAYAIDKLRHTFNIPIIDVIKPGAEKAVQMTRSGCIAVLGTKGTIQSKAYQTSITRLLPEAEIFPIACPLFVPLVEEYLIDHPAARLIVKDYLTPLKTTKVDTVILGCTHYPFLKNLIQEELQSDICFVDPAATCAEQVATTLKQHHLHTSQTKPNYSYYVSDDPDKFTEIAAKLFQQRIDCSKID